MSIRDPNSPSNNREPRPGGWFAPPRAYVLLFALTLAVRIATALPVQQAGYMDASYALHVAENLAMGRSLTEDILWNYLDQPQGLPHPSNQYWMPLPSLLIAPFFAVLGVSYRAAQIPFVVLSLFLPLFAFYLARRVLGRDDYAWMAAVFTLFSGFYMVYWVSPDNFTPFAVSASLCLYAISRGAESGRRRYFVAAGILAGLSHLSRADGILLLAVPPIALLVLSRKPEAGYDLRRISVLTLCVLLGYLLVMSPWFWRNYVTLGTPYPSAGTKTLWLTNYDELFRFADDLTFSRFLAWGIGPILGSKLFAAGLNLVILSFADSQLFLTPFALVGLWQLRRRIELLPFFVFLGLLYAVMTLAFTFPSTRGSMLHSAVALLPFFSVAAPPGIDAAIRWIARWRKGWQLAQAISFFRIGSIALAVIISLYIYAPGFFGAVVQGASPLWNQRDAQYPEVARWLDQHARGDDVVMAIDPPSFYNVSHRRAIMIPTDGVGAIFDAAARYGAKYMILEFDHPAPLRELYAGKSTVPGLEPVASFQDAAGRPVTLYRIAR